MGRVGFEPPIMSSVNPSAVGSIPLYRAVSGPLRSPQICVYFGLDRFATDGSAQVGFWFTKNNIAQTNVKKNGAFLFSGAHAEEDILVQSNFTNGGDVDTVSVFRWDPNVSGNLDPVVNAEDCDNATADAIACAVVNKAPTDSPWSYIPKGASTDSDFPVSGFYEGGINLSRVAREAGAATGTCLSTFIAETRSSHPFDATLKDVDLGKFDTCDAAVTTESSTTVNGVPATNVQPGTQVSDTATITGTSLVGGTAPRPTGTARFFLCRPTTPTSEVTAAGCPSGGTEVLPPDDTLVQGSATNQSIATSALTPSNLTNLKGKSRLRNLRLPPSRA
jgi:hypothetical protein